ncbi:MAG: hypothetical protein R3B81_19400 [bacterium]
MERRDALKTMRWAIGGLSIARPIRSASAAESARDLSGRGACWITPDETEGPFYFDPSLIRNDVREGFASLEAAGERAATRLVRVR